MNSIIKIGGAIVALAVITTGAIFASANENDGREKYQIMSEEALVSMISREHKIKPEVVRFAIKGAHFITKIVPKARRGGYEAKGYDSYRKLFVNSSMEKRGKAFIAENGQALQEAEDIFGVNKEVIVAILGVETKFGTQPGTRNVRDVLYTLALAHPRRSKFFRDELATLIKIAGKNGIDIHRIKGSYAGAFGAGQFMPTSFQEYAIDGNRDGKIDMFNNKRDIFYSVANYFKRHRWIKDQPVAVWVPRNVKLPQRWIEHAESGHLKSWTKLGDLKDEIKTGGDSLGKGWDDMSKVSIIKLRGIDRYLLVSKNFRTIMHYNPSFNYAMAITELSSLWSDKKINLSYK